MFSSPLLLGAVAIEGYAVLAVELLAIRQLTPYMDNATDTVAIVIAAVLLPLAFDYEAGGRASFSPGDETAVRRQLTRNLLIAAFILSFGLSHPFLAAYFPILDSLSLTHRLVQAAVQALLQKPVKPQDVVVVAPGKGLLIVPPAVDATEPTL